jgi:diguanylate cyclase (GGDEF)-like protein
MSSLLTRRPSRRAFLPWLWVCVCAFLTLSTHAAERGLPLITVFPAEVHKAGPQTFDIAQDSRGILHFGNLHGLVTYDGAWWRVHSLPDEQVALSLAADANGRLAIGLVNDFGWFDFESQQYRSLLAQIPATKRNFGDVRSICATSHGFLYLTERSLFLWNGTSTRLVAEYTPEDVPRGCHAEGNDVLLRGPKGLFRFEPATLRIAPTPLTKRVLVALKRGDGSIVAAVRDEGLYLVDDKGATPFAPEASAWTKGKIVTGGVRLIDGRLVITTRQNGLAILDQAGNIEQIIGADAGLPDAVLNEPKVDREGSLWLAMEGPIVRIDLASPVTVFDARRGLRGGAGDLARHGDEVYAAMTHGLYAIDVHGDARRVEGMQEGAWRVLAVDDELLVGSVKGFYTVNAGGALAHVIDRDGSVYDLARSTIDPSRVWVAEEDGVSSVRRVNGTWVYEGVIAGTAQDISSVIEQDGVVWAGTVFEGILRIDNARGADPRGAKPRVQKFGSGEMNVFRIGGRLVFVRATGQVLQLDSAGRFIPDPILGHIKAPRGFFVVAEDARGNVWINSTPPRVFERQADGTYAKEGRPLVAVTAADIQNVRIGDDGAIWFASDKGLFRYEPGDARAQLMPQPAPLVRRIVAGDQVLPARGTTELGHKFGRMRIEFAPVSYRPGISYQYRLDPIDARWSEWGDEPFIDYTTLEPNDYTFRLRARGPAMTAGEETRWSFSVLPPWYRTRLATALWLLLAIAAVIAVIRVRTGALRRQAEKLRAKVADKTAELQQTVALLEAANTQLEALSLEDDLTGIANRRSFERALADEWNRARRHEQSLALILLDLDHFKELNDRRGHPAGDDCLRRVGAFLADTIRRSGEVVARYGGEEFAILLPGVDADVAIRVAETLRDGIEHLGVPYGNGTGRRVTASCGVAAMIPDSRVTAEGLVANADRALYAAKHSGRNCVRVADETTTGTWLRDVSA